MKVWLKTIHFLPIYNLKIRIFLFHPHENQTQMMGGIHGTQLI